MPFEFFSYGPVIQTALIIGGLLVIYFIKEWWINFQYQIPPTSRPSVQAQPILKEDKNIVSTPSPEPQVQSSEKTTTVMMGTKNFKFSTGKNKETEVVLTADLINKVQSFGTANSWLKSIVSKMVPQPALDDLIKLAIEGKLHPGMKVIIKNGYLTLRDAQSSPEKEDSA
ncbi:MAG: hypothetical protein P1V18_02595 [Candidatus Gracilibacteria bacterium]|nr:hypothetical protein [Candidatus Gracilibacteria bacterium]